LKAAYPEAITENEKLNGKRVKLRGNRGTEQVFHGTGRQLATTSDK